SEIERCYENGSSAEPGGQAHDIGVPAPDLRRGFSDRLTTHKSPPHTGSRPTNPRQGPQATTTLQTGICCIGSIGNLRGLGAWSGDSHFTCSDGVTTTSASRWWGAQS